MQCTTNQFQTRSDRETHIHNEHGTRNKSPEITGIIRNPPDTETLSLMCVSLNKDLT